MNIKWKVTKKKLQPFLDEKGLELLECKSSYLHYYFLSVKGAGQFQPVYHCKIHFHTLKRVLEFLLSHPHFNWKTIDSCNFPDNISNI